MNVPKIKGTHTAMKSGMLAAEAVFPRLAVLEEDSAPTAGNLSRSSGNSYHSGTSPSSGTSSFYFSSSSWF